MPTYFILFEYYIQYRNDQISCSYPKKYRKNTRVTTSATLFNLEKIADMYFYFEQTHNYINYIVPKKNM